MGHPAALPPLRTQALATDQTRTRELLQVHTLSVDSIDGAVDETELAEISDTERAVYGFVTSLELLAFLDAWAKDRLGSPIVKVRFRAGRIDVVWGVELGDGRPVVAVRGLACPSSRPSCRCGRRSRRGW
jgi:hypothetical protein